MTEGDPIPSPDAAGKPSVFAPEGFGKYYLLDRVATGGMAEIFKAKTFGHGGFENLLVIKRILSHLSSNEQFVQMFLDEAKVSALLHHANIVRIYDFGRLRDNYFLAMEFVEGKDLKMLLRKLAERRKLLPREFAVFLAMESAKGLDYAHKRTTLQGAPLNIVHRDVTPSNLLLSYNGEVKVADFGIVKAANCAETTGVGTLKGKFEYMSPEQASGKDIDRRSDIFSLGIILHEMLTGRRLFKTDSEIRTLEKIKSCEIDPPSALNPQVPARLDEICMRALAGDPDDRYQDAREMHAELLEFLYPASPDTTQQSLSHFMRELFSEEIEQERSRLEESTRQALSLHEAQSSVDLEPDWEEGGHTGSQVKPPEPPPPPRSRFPMWIVGGLAGAFMLFAGVALATILLTNREGSTPSPVTVEEVAVATGTLQLNLTPATARVYLDEKEAGTGAEVIIGDLSPDVPHAVRVEAEGYQPWSEKVTVAAGERLRMPVTLSKASATEKRPPAETKTPADTRPGTMIFQSNPAGADVVVDGRVVGKTPLEWEATGGKKYAVEYRLSGYDSVRISATVSGGDREPFSRTLKETVAAAPGKVQVNVRGGWGDVYLDGNKVGTTPFSSSVSAGKHTIRVVNADTGLDRTEIVDVKAGETRPVSIAGG